MNFDKAKMFITCDGCGKKIKYGADAYNIDGYCGIYHCMRCATAYFGREYVDEVTVDNYLISNCQARVYTTQFKKNKNDKPIELKVEAVYEDRPQTWTESYTEYEGDWLTGHEVHKTRKVTKVLPTRVGWQWSLAKNGKKI